MTARRNRLVSLRLVALCAALGLGAVAAPDTAQGFDPRGRKKSGASGGKGASRTRPKARGATVASREAQPESVERLIARYKRVALEQPGVVFPLQRLAALSRGQEGGLGALLAEFEALSQVPGQQQYRPLVALAGLLVLDNQLDDAARRFEQALAVAPGEPRVRVAYADLLIRLGRQAEAASQLEVALGALTEPMERETTARRLMQLQLDQGNVTAARRFHETLVQAAGGSYFVRAEFASELLARRLYPEAEAESRKLVDGAAGDARALAPALRDYGRVLLKTAKFDRAQSALWRAARASPPGSGLRREVFSLLVEAARGALELPHIGERLAQMMADFEAQRAAARVFEELGQLEAALKAARRAQTLRPRDIEVRQQLIELLELQGQFESALEQRRALVSQSPDDVGAAVALVEALRMQGRRADALHTLRTLEGRAQHQPELLDRIVDLYDKLGEHPQVERLLRKAAAGSGHDVERLMELGRRLFRAGQSDAALEVWRRMLKSGDPAALRRRLGDVLLEHGLVAEAVLELERAQADSPGDLATKKLLARAYERRATLDGAATPDADRAAAIALWRELLWSKQGDAPARSEAQNHLVTLWSFAGVLEAESRVLEDAFGRTPPDEVAGRLLVEVYLRLGAAERAESTLARLLDLNPNDISALTRLERLLVQRLDYRRALEIVARLVKADAPRARAHLRRMSQYAERLYEDDAALRYALQAAQAGPDDATLNLRLAQLHRQRGQFAEAILELRRALAADPALFEAAFLLSDLLLDAGKRDEADELLREVVRRARDEEIILRAGRTSVELHRQAGTLLKLERDWAPLLVGQTRLATHRHLLLELYTQWARPHLEALQSADAVIVEAARGALRSLAPRAIRPLVESLADESAAVRRQALNLLAAIASPLANAALVAFATGPGEAELRAEALLVVAQAPAPELESRLLALLGDAPEYAADGDVVALAALWTLLRLDTPAALRLGEGALNATSVASRVLAALAAAEREKVSPTTTALMREKLESLEESGAVRAAAALYFSVHPRPEVVGALRELSLESEPVLRWAGLSALVSARAEEGRMRLCTQLVAGPRGSGARALALLSGIGKKRGLNPAARELAVPYALIGQWLDVPVSDAQRIAALELAAPDLAAAVHDTLGAEPASAARLARLLDAPAEGRTLWGIESARLEGGLRQRLAALVDTVLERSALVFLPALDSPSTADRGVVSAFLARRSEAPVVEAVNGRLMDDAPPVQRAILGALRSESLLAHLGPVISLLGSSRSWTVRVAAASALFGSAALPPAAQERALGALERAAAGDRYALVREAAVRSLHWVPYPQRSAIGARLLATEVEPAVRDALGHLMENYDG